MVIDPFDGFRRRLRQITDAHAKSERRLANPPRGNASATSPSRRTAASRTLAARLKTEIGGLDLGKPADQDRAVEKFVTLVLAEELGAEILNGAEFHGLVERVASTLMEGEVRSDLLKVFGDLR